MFKRLLRLWPFYLLILVELAVFLANYRPQTFLIGWDNLYPEFSPLLNIQRSLFSVWQQYRSLGYLDGMSHAANLFHDIWRAVLTVIFPLYFVRWFTIFLLHLTGGIGMYILFHQYIFRQTKGVLTQLFSLFGALYYQLNLMTVQQFFLPFELFLFHYAFLPWLVFSALQFVETKRKRFLWIFAISSFLSLPQAHVPTIFIVYIAIIALILGTKLIVDKGKTWKPVIVLIAVIFAINAYWGIPFAYGTVKNAQTIANSKNNQMATDDIYYRNIKFSGLTDLILMKGVVLDYWQYDIRSSTSEYMMKPWREYINNPLYVFSSMIIFFLTITGAIVILYKRKKEFLSFVLVTFFAFAMLGQNIPIFSIIPHFLQQYVPLFYNIFRFVFTKFALMYVFGVSILFIVGLDYLTSKVRKLYRFGLLFAAGVLFFVSCFPVFTGNLFYKNLAAKMPTEYFDMFKFFSKQPADGRVLILPVTSYWAWTQNNWNTIGSGFMWYGIPQPTTDRAFDPWSDRNENLYWEVEQAIYSEDELKLSDVLKKYDIRWVLFDQTVYLGSAPKFGTFRYEDLLQKNNLLTKFHQFGKLSIYKVNSKSEIHDFVGIYSSLPTIDPPYTFTNWDGVYSKLGNYLVSMHDTSYVYPFRSLFTGRSVTERDFTVSEDERNLSVSHELTGSLRYAKVYVPSVLTNEAEEVEYLASYSAQVSIENNPQEKLQVQIPKEANLVYDSLRDITFPTKLNDGCDKSANGFSLVETMKQGRSFTSIGSTNCINLDLWNLSQRYGYLIMLQTKNSTVKGLLFNVINHQTLKSDLDTYLPHDGKNAQYWFILPPRNPFGFGYTFNFNNISFGSELVQNELKRVRIFKIPYLFMKSIYLSHEPITSRQALYQNTYIKSDLSLPFIHRVLLSKNGVNDVLYLSQAFDTDWKAYSVSDKGFINTYFPFLFGKQLTDHVLVNNWANAWLLRPNKIGTTAPEGKEQKVVIIFWPQYLQYIGFALLGTTILVIVLYSVKKKKNHTPLHL